MKGHPHPQTDVGGTMTTTDELREVARKCRVHIVDMVYRAQAGHPGGSLSEIDLLTALYKTQLNVRPSEPKWEDRDRFILSKGHASPGMYAILAETIGNLIHSLKPKQR